MSFHFDEPKTSRAQLEEFLLYWILVAGKNAKVQAGKLDAWMMTLRTLTCSSMMDRPFALLARAHDRSKLQASMKAVKTGKYDVLFNACLYLISHARLNLATCSVEDLMQIPGVGPKTARCFIMYTRPGALVAGLDTHVMKYMHARGHTPTLQKAPKSARQYDELERLFVIEAADAGLTPRELDSQLWRHYAGR